MNGMFWLMNLAGEVGELCNKYKRMIRINVIDKRLIVDEAGDILWYLTTVLDTFGISLEEVARNNLVKLANRLEDQPDYYAVKNGRSTYDDAHNPDRSARPNESH